MIARPLVAFLLCVSLAFVGSSTLFAYSTWPEPGRMYFSGSAYHHNNWTYNAGSNSYGFDLIRNVSGGGEPANWIVTPSIVDSSGYVMPNRQTTYASSSSGKGGAVGFNALDITSGTNNTDKKKAFFCFLQQKNGVKSAERNPDCSPWTNADDDKLGEWEKMGSALIVRQLLGQSKPTSNSTGWSMSVPANSSEWNNLYKRLVVNNNIVMDYDSNYNVLVDSSGNSVVNTAGIYRKGDGKIDTINVTLTGSPSTQYVWVLKNRNTGHIYYALEFNCANPIGALNALPIVVEDYNLIPKLDLSGATGGAINVGNPLNIKGSVENDKSSSASGVRWTVTKLVFNSMPNATSRASKTNSASDPCAAFAGSISCTTGSPTNMTNRTINGNSATPSTEGASTYSPVSSEAGKVICYVTSVTPPSPANSGKWNHSKMECVTVGSFRLTPRVELTEETVDPGAELSVRSIVQNDSDPSNEVEWFLHQYVYNPGAHPTDSEKIGNYDSSSNVYTRPNDNPCAYFTNTDRRPGTAGCENNTSFYIKRSFSASESVTRESGQGGIPKIMIPDDAPTGTKYCYVTSVKPPTALVGIDWGHSDMKCVVVAKKPKMQVWGGDVRVGGFINTSTSKIAGRTYGSWGEFGVIARGKNCEMASGAAFNGGFSGGSIPEWNKLTFANTGSIDCSSYGNFGSLNSPKSISGQFENLASADPSITADTQTIDQLLGGSGKYIRNGNLTITGGTVLKGKTIILNVTGTVNIINDIKYFEGPYSSISEIPQLVIRANRINIGADVTEVNAWLIASNDAGSGSIYTCTKNDGSLIGELTVGVCNKPLMINGPVITNKLHLLRTKGAEGDDTGRAEPAEVFNLRADSYLWGKSYSSNVKRIQTTMLREQPPRF